MKAVFNIKNDRPYPADDFRGQMWWSFHNFNTNPLTYDQFAQTFADVDPEENIVHPINKLYYALLYKHSAKGGNCEGMSLESIFARINRSPYSEPIHQYFPDTQDGKDLTLAMQDGDHLSLENQINVKHGYQVGATTSSGC